MISSDMKQFLDKFWILILVYCVDLAFGAAYSIRSVFCDGLATDPELASGLPVVDADSCGIFPALLFELALKPLSFESQASELFPVDQQLQLPSIVHCNLALCRSVDPHYS